MQAVFGEHKSTKLFYEKGGTFGQNVLKRKREFRGCADWCFARRFC